MLNENVKFLKVQKFLLHNNAIEGVYDPESLEDAWTAWEYLVYQPKLTLEVVLKTHEILMQRQQLLKKYKGALRDCDVYIGGHIALRPEMLESALWHWLERMNSTSVDNLDWKELHVQYEAIHPFADGNGRTGRMFMNWHRLNKLGMDVLVITEGAEQMEYYKWFK